SDSRLIISLVFSNYSAESMFLMVNVMDGDSPVFCWSLLSFKAWYDGVVSFNLNDGWFSTLMIILIF
ncbi:MAG: hypothetical protein QXH91_00955, partial [Candidatus Bathyarchaeia archaeon]